MKALTIHQPFAGLIAAGLKTCENRTWATNYRGPLAIHAGLSEKWGSEDDWLDFWEHEVPWGPGECLPRDDSDIMRGGIVAVCALVDCVKVDDPRLKLCKYFGAKPAQRRHFEGPWCWILANPRPVWVPCKGQQGLWTPSADVLTAIAKGNPL